MGRLWLTRSLTLENMPDYFNFDVHIRLIAFFEGYSFCLDNALISDGDVF